MKDEFDKILCEKYPKLFQNRHKPMTETAMCWGFECGDGWFDLIDKLCESIQNYIDNNPNTKCPQVVVDQVKEKFGGLRFYYTGGNDKIHGMVWFAESMSYRICETCGSPGKPRRSGWIRTLCDKHSENKEVINFKEN